MAAVLFVLALTSSVVMTSIAGLGEPVIPIIVAVVLGGLAWGAHRITSAQLRTQFGELVIEHADTTLAQIFEAAFTIPAVVTEQSRIRELLPVLTCTGRFGDTIRNCPPTHARPIEPIEVPFEARPLNESDPSVAELERSLEENPDADLLDPDALRDPEPERRGASQIRRSVTLAGGWWVPALLVLPLTFAAMDSFARREVTWALIVWTVILVSFLFGRTASADAFSTTQWFVVPGGLLLRRFKRGNGGWQLHLFERQESLLIAHRGEFNRWTITVGDADCAGQIFVTQTEADFLLRAWLSPIPPPPVEQLSDLT
ncbi:MAG: hypothetical protein PVI86_18345 [Phycisphaerae bacterium]|jgi:hypothetical protein